jgi:hypothetical protein
MDLGSPEPLLVGPRRLHGAWPIQPPPVPKSILRLPLPRDENGFKIFQYSGNRFWNFLIGFTGNGIFRKRNRFLEFSIRIGIGNRRGGLTTVFFSCRFFVGNYWICVSEFSGIVSQNFFKFSSMWFFRIVCTSLDKDYLFLYFLDALRFFWDRWCWKAVEIKIWSLERIHPFLCTCHEVCLFHTLDFRVLLWGCEKTLYVRKKYFISKHAMSAKSSGYCELWTLSLWTCDLYELVILWTCYIVNLWSL